MNSGSHQMKLMVAFVALWAAEEALIGLLLGRYGLIQIVWLRFALHLVLLWAICGGTKGGALWRTQRPGFQLLRASMMVGMPACWALGARHGLSPATLMSVFWLAPLLILGLAGLFLKERVPAKVWLAVVAACVGVFALTGPHAMPRAILLVYPLGMAMCFSVYVVMTRSLRNEPTRTNLFYTGLGVCLLLAPLVPSGWVTPSVPDLLTLTGVALLGLGGLWALERLTAAAPVSAAAPLVYLQIPFAIGIAWGLGHYDPTLRTMGGLLVIGAVVLHAWLLEARRAAPLVPDSAHQGLE
jgi:drug/metabolite transporter (DMT)-like permease